MEQRSNHLGRLELKRTAGDRKTAHIAVSGRVRDVVLQAVGQLDLVTDEVGVSALSKRIRPRSRLVVLDVSADRLETICRRIRQHRHGWSLALVLVGQALADREHAAILCKRLDADLALPPSAPRMLFQEQMDAALFRRAPLADFGVLPSGVADELDAVFGTLNRVDYYGVFGVSRQAHSDDIKERFHALAQLAHPDRYRRFVEDRKFIHDRIRTIYKRISEAYHVLENPVRRAVYDLCLRTQGRMRYEPETLRVSWQRELGISETEAARLAVAENLLARSMGDWPSAEAALRRAQDLEPNNSAIQALLASVSWVRSLADQSGTKADSRRG